MFSALYRVLAAAWGKTVVKWRGACMPPELRGCRRRGEALEVSLKVSLEVEANATTKRKRAVGAEFFDYAKFFDKLPWAMISDLPGD